MPRRPLLMIPGPIEISDAVYEATCVRPVSHVSPGFKASFGKALGQMRQVWCAPDDHQPFVIAGSGTLAMESAAVNLVDPKDRVLVVNTGYFGDRMAEMLTRRGAEVFQVGAMPGHAPSMHEIDAAIQEHPVHAVFATHVDTSTGVRLDVESLAAITNTRGVLSVVDGVCATAAEVTLQGAWGVDVVLTASQKAIGLPPGLALWMVSPRALEKRRALQSAPPMSLDWLQWLPIMQAYEAETNAYFGTPPTSLLPALEVGLTELLHEGMPAVFARHQAAATAMRAAWAAMGLASLSTAPANTLSALKWPSGAGPEALPRIAAHGAIVAGGLHPAIRATYFRVGHMGEVTRNREALRQTVEAIGKGLNEVGAAVPIDDALAAFDQSSS